MEPCSGTCDGLQAQHQPEVMAHSSTCRCLHWRTSAALTCTWSGMFSAVTGCTSGAQVFVANPNKTPAIVDILAGNKEKLLRYLKDFHNDTSARFYRMLLLLRGSTRACQLLRSKRRMSTFVPAAVRVCIRQRPPRSIAQVQWMCLCRRRAVQRGKGGDYKGDQHTGAKQVTQARPAAAGRAESAPRCRCMCHSTVSAQGQRSWQLGCALLLDDIACLSM